jgi:hypothetical protein
MPIDVTDLVQRYRLALRHIWNSCFWVDPKLRTWDSVCAFRELQRPLFYALIAAPLDIGTDGTIFGPQFRVVPDMENGAGLSSIEVNRRLPGGPDGGIWERVQGWFSPDDIQMSLVDLFDWSPLGYIDLRYYEVLVESLPRCPDKAGHHALVDVAGVKVFWDGGDEAEATAPPPTPNVG